MRTSGWSKALTYAALAVLAAFFLLPFYVIFRNAFSTTRWTPAKKSNSRAKTVP